MHTPNDTCCVMITDDDSGNAHPTWKTLAMAINRSHSHLRWEIANCTGRAVDVVIVWANATQNPTNGDVEINGIPSGVI